VNKQYIKKKTYRGSNTTHLKPLLPLLAPYTPLVSFPCPLLLQCHSWWWWYCDESDDGHLQLETRGGEDKNDTTTSHRDSLVVLVIDERRRGWEQHTNESWWLVGGLGDWWRAERMRTTLQRIIVTRWQWWSTRDGNDENDAPTRAVHRTVLRVRP
jgi:hypothetical protein